MFKKAICEIARGPGLDGTTIPCGSSSCQELDDGSDGCEIRKRVIDDDAGGAGGGGRYPKDSCIFAYIYYM